MKQGKKYVHSTELIRERKVDQFFSTTTCLLPLTRFLFGQKMFTANPSVDSSQPTDPSLFWPSKTTTIYANAASSDHN